MATSQPTRRRGTPAPLKLAMKLAVGMYRLTGGAVGGKLGPNSVLLLTTTGRRSGAPHTVPVSYFQDGDNIVLVASNGGADQHPAWYLNITAHSQVEIQIKRQRRSATATIASPEERKRIFADVVSRSPGYGKYQRRTTRVIPIVLLPAA
jgi:deazaflavin-dependent oxidoreductase (nitroreductase family)